MPHQRLDSLRAQREAAGLTQDQLARRANVSLLLIQRLESLPGVSGGSSGTCEPHEAQRIADALGVSLTTLGHKSL
jgi:predicted transcriptional regulator